ncbi:cytochrome P450 [Saccharopolyspora sp. K220]|uniref:cytochrome P450 n=1 Tax=Saccharopolyspora soli TaxID=2926618 RepID=UPI001F5878C6|nr:cytochrome P450 [Saccharopolyspora soli]MCI2422906.1 cytochrome P450 [Saccharopolyspora soli]
MRPTPPPNCPAHAGTGGSALFGPEFAADPNAVYDRLRREFGTVAPVELEEGVSAMLVLDHRVALEVLTNPGMWRKDSRSWEAGARSVPVMMQWRPNCLYADGAEHARLRAAVTDSLDRVDTVALRGSVERHARALIHRFGPSGQADLVVQYAARLPLLAITDLVGCPADFGTRVVEHVRAVFDGRDQGYHNEQLSRCLAELIAFKRRKRGPDVASWLIDHPAQLNDEELLHQLVVTMGAGVEPTAAWICSTLALLLTDDRFGGDLTGGGLSIQDALHQVLVNAPPIANYAVHYPQQDVVLGGWRLAAQQPVVISFAAVHRQLIEGGAAARGRRAHLAFSAGPHLCPAQSHAELIATVAIETVLDRLPEIELAVPAGELRWRPGAFHRALDSLPVRFTPITVPAETGGDRPWPAPIASIPPVPTSTAKHGGSALARALRRWFSFLAG